MNTHHQVSSKQTSAQPILLQARQQKLLTNTLQIFLGIVSISLISLLILWMLSGYIYQLLVSAVALIPLIGALYWTGKGVDGPQFWLRLHVLIFTLFLSGVVSAIFFHTGYFVLFGITILAMLLVSVANLPQLIKWIAPLGTVLLLLFSALDLGLVLENVHYGKETAVEFVIPAITVGLLAVAALLLFLLNTMLINTLNTVQQRSAEAEEASRIANASLDQVRAQAEEQARLLELVQDLETPAIPVLPGVLVLPIVGHLDTRRITHLTDTLLDKVAAERTRQVLLDLTGVSIIDTATANHILQLINSVRLLGAHCTMTGIRAEVAQTLVSLGVDWGKIVTAASLQEAVIDLTQELALNAAR